MPRHEPPEASARGQSLAGELTFDELVDLIVSRFDPSCLSADHAVELLFLVDYIRAELCAAHGETFQALKGEPEPGAIF